MEKPYKTMTQNILWLIKEKGPITTAQIEAELKSGYGLSGSLAIIWKRLKFDYIDREEVPGKTEAKKAYSYSMPKENYGTVEQMHARYLQAGRKPPRGVATAEKKTVNEAIEKALTEALGVEVKVSGKIEVLFGFINKE